MNQVRNITLDGHLLNGKAPYKIASGGLGRTFQNIRLFKDLSVLDNVLIAFANHHKPHVFASLFRLPSYYKNEEALKAKALELLAIFGWKRSRYLGQKLSLRTTTSLGDRSCPCYRAKNPLLG